MIFSYSEALSRFKSAYQIAKAVEDKQLYKLEEGIYSDSQYYSEIGIIAKKYPSAVFTGESAFYYHDLTDLVPEKYVLATKSKAAKINDDRIIQVYVPESIFELGIITKEINGASISIYDKERMLIELLRNKNKLPYDLYKDVLYKYRNMMESLQIWRIQEYADIFPKSKMIKKALDEEVF